MSERIQAETEINFIKKVIEDSKRATVDNGRGFINWGLLGLIGIAFTYADYYLKIGIGSLYIWIGVFAAGIIYILIMILRGTRKDRVKTLAGSLLGAVWVACLVTSAFMLVLPAIVKNIPAVITLTSILFVIGAGYFVSSYIFDYKWIRLIGYAWWAGGFVNSLIIFPHSQMVILASLLIFFQIIPGMIIYKKWEKEIASGKI